MFHYNIKVLYPCKVIMNYVWSPRWGKLEGEQCYKNNPNPHVDVLPRLWYLWLCQIPSHSVCIYIIACRYLASCILKKTRGWPHVILFACDSFTFWNGVYIGMEKKEHLVPHQSIQTFKHYGLDPHPWAIMKISQFARAAYRTQEANLLTSLPIYYKGYQGYESTTRWRDTQTKVYGKGHRCAMLSPSMLSSQHLHNFPRLLEPCPLGFYEGFIT